MTADPSPSCLDAKTDPRPSQGQGRQCVQRADSNTAGQEGVDRTVTVLAYMSPMSRRLAWAPASPITT